MKEPGGRHRGRHLQRRERYTLTLVIVVVIFVICELPDLFLRSWMLLRGISAEHVSYPLDTLRAVNIISNLCLTINSSVNFIIYCLVGQRFRNVLARILCSDARPPLRRRNRLRWVGHTDGRTRSSGRVVEPAAWRIIERTADNSQ